MTVQSIRHPSSDRVRRVVLDIIRTDGLQVGDRLPSERELAKRLGMNHLTVRKGLAELVDQRVIDRRVGSGTYLREVPTAGETGTTSVKATVGALVVAKTGTFVGEMLSQMHREAERLGLQMTMRTVGSLGAEANEAIRDFKRQGALAAVLPWWPEPVSVSDVNRLVQSSPIPVVLPAALPGLEANCYESVSVVGRGDYQPVEMACEYFHSLNYKHIGFFGPDTLYVDSLNRRVMAYTRFASRHGLNTYVGLATSDASDVDRIVRGWVPLAGDLAVICHDDDFAIRLMTAVHKQGLRIPEDVAILGFNNIPLGESTDPPLSTIQFDYEYVTSGMLNHALELAGSALQQEPRAARELLVIRASCGGVLRAGDRLGEVVDQAQACWSQSGSSQAPATGRR